MSGWLIAVTAYLSISSTTAAWSAAADIFATKLRPRVYSNGAGDVFANTLLMFFFWPFIVGLLVRDTIKLQREYRQQLASIHREPNEPIDVTCVWCSGPNGPNCGCRRVPTRERSARSILVEEIERMRRDKAAHAARPANVGNNKK